MVITDSAVKTASAYQHTLVESSRTRTYNYIKFTPREEARDSAENGEKLAISDKNEKDAASNTDKLELNQRPQRPKFIPAAKQYLNVGKVGGHAPVQIQSTDQLKISMLQKMLEKLTGKKYAPCAPEESAEGVHGGSHTMPGVSFGGFGVSLSGNSPAGAVEYQRTEFDYFRHEAESVSYSAEGIVNTADGRSISVNISMNMYQSETISMSGFSDKVQERRLCDPLVFSFDGTFADLEGESFDFDLTMDGNLERINFAGQGKGFLALDKNGDGSINDGSELFGPRTGNGFAELAQYDEDGNGWIDENDKIFDTLRIWTRDKDGNDKLYTLKEMDVGAIYLGAEKTQFGFAAGQLKSTSFFLKESGGAGTLSHVDMYV